MRGCQLTDIGPAGLQAEQESADSGLFHNFGSDRSTRRDNVGGVVVAQERVTDRASERKERAFKTIHLDQGIGATLGSCRCTLYINSSTAYY